MSGFSQQEIASSDASSENQDEQTVLLSSIASIADHISSSIDLQSTSAKQDEQTALLTTIQSLTDAILTNQTTITNQITIANTLDSILGRMSSSATLFKNLGANSTLNIKDSTGIVYSIACYNTNGAARFIQLWNSATDATAGTLICSFLISSNSQIIIGTDFFTSLGINFSSGIAFGYSTSATTYSAGTAGEQMTFVSYA